MNIAVFQKLGPDAAGQLVVADDDLPLDAEFLRFKLGESGRTRLGTGAPAEGKTRVFFNRFVP